MRMYFSIKFSFQTRNVYFILNIFSFSFSRRCTEKGYKPSGGGICFKQSDVTKLTRQTNQGRSRIDPDHHSGKYQRNFILFKLFIF